MYLIPVWCVIRLQTGYSFLVLQHMFASYFHLNWANWILLQVKEFFIVTTAANVGGEL